MGEFNCPFTQGKKPCGVNGSQSPNAVFIKNTQANFKIHLIFKSTFKLWNDHISGWNIRDLGEGARNEVLLCGGQTESEPLLDSLSLSLAPSKLRRVWCQVFSSRSKTYSSSFPSWIRTNDVYDVAQKNYPFSKFFEYLRNNCINFSEPKFTVATIIPNQSWSLLSSKHRNWQGNQKRSDCCTLCTLILTLE